MRPRAGAALHAVDVNAVGVGLCRHAHVVVDARSAQLQLNRDLPVGGLADLLDLERQIVGAQPVWMTRGRALIDARRQRAHLGHLVGDLLTHEMTAETDLAALPDEELARVGQAKVVRIEAVSGLDALVVPLLRVPALVGDHAAFARAGGGARHGRPARERGLGLIAERAEAHTGDVDRDVEHERAFRARPEHGLRVALLAIALDDEPCQCSRQERQVIPGRDLLEHREAAHAIATELRLDVNVVDDLGREQKALSEPVARALRGIRRVCSGSF